MYQFSDTGEMVAHAEFTGPKREAQADRSGGPMLQSITPSVATFSFHEFTFRRAWLMSQATASEHALASMAIVRRILKPLSVIEIAGAAALSMFAGLPVWVALAGWASYYTSGSSQRDGAYNLACVVTGLGIGIVAEAAAVNWQSSLGILALPVALLLAASSVWLMNMVTGVQNIASYLIGVAVVWVADTATSLDGYLLLTAAVTVGAVFGALSDMIDPRRKTESE